tara:strand:- start:1929 stop:2075 length:147 start_codon:yes stop_codon:yes gene_type:complete
VVERHRLCLPVDGRGQHSTEHYHRVGGMLDVRRCGTPPLRGIVIHRVQ